MIGESPQQSSQLCAALIESVPVAMIVLNSDGRVTLWNAEAERLFGFPASETLGRALPILPAGKEAEGRQILEDGLKGISVNNHETVRCHKEGFMVDVQLSVAPLRGANVAHSSVIELYRDISERKRLERESQVRRQHLIMADKMDALSTLVSGAAHEINNPTSLISLNVPLLREMWERALPILDAYYEENGDFALGAMPYSEMKDYVPKLCSVMLEGAGKISRIVNNLRDYARATPPGELEVIDINTVVMSSTTLLSNVIRKSTDRFDVTYARKLPTVVGSFQGLEQVIVNLLLNACQSLPSPVQGIWVETVHDPSSNNVGIVVRDEGCGIHPDSLTRITDPFFTTGREAGRTGLGLAVAASIVKEHGGRLEFASQPGCGTDVCVWLPAEPCEIEEHP